jgi:hypothetical protein
MIRTQIQFTEEELSALRRESAQRGVSISAVVREAVDLSLAKAGRGASREELAQRAVAVAGRFHSGLADLAARHDDYFADSIDE